MNPDFIVVFAISLSNRLSIGGRKHSTINIDKSVPRPNKSPMSLMLEFDDVIYSVNPDIDSVNPDIRIDLKAEPSDL